MRLSHGTGALRRTGAVGIGVVLAASVLVGGGGAVASSGHGSGHGPGPVGGHGRCTTAVAAGTHQVPVTFGGARYDVRVHVPAGVRSPALVLDLHGSGADGAAQSAISGLDALGDEKGFVAVEPDGAIPLNGGWAWNVPGVPTTAGQMPPADARDDVAFLGAVIDQVGRVVCADDRRVYATGYSGGGRMASALACRLSDRLAAVGTVAGLRAGRPSPLDTSVPDVADCTPTRAVPVVEFHGDADYTNPYQGSSDLRWGYTVPVAVQTWARLDGCRVGPTTTVVSEHVTRYAYSRCSSGADVQLYRVAGGGHTWPGTSVDQSSNGTVTQEISASRILWDFFAAHPRR
ncbi:extracellular catalytic domain type 1 short-chain-length polyhydroxyalkanoate depolymerase [Luteimicrobium subarcticum]|uniref:Polyhydroxybutyrate depolymerase n=1 Tax=Luteimicrobium subarcticum TaxID=620910 RepID=A0A2M8WRK5_9MICO|nr:PHB depolymerase family esterase [Luteimicrobium subarcticum]PJI93580.1 polyhydroxybutyrate depolymerase [Luteimicrobium subarcticum]